MKIRKRVQFQSNHLRDQLWWQLSCRLGIQLSINLRDSLGDQLKINLRGHLGNVNKVSYED